MLKVSVTVREKPSCCLTLGKRKRNSLSFKNLVDIYSIFMIIHILSAKGPLHTLSSTSEVVKEQVGPTKRKKLIYMF